MTQIVYFYRHLLTFALIFAQFSTNGLAICGAYDMANPLAAPEIFINCAEVAITGGSGSAPVASPSRAPTVRSPTRKPVKTPSNTKSPVKNNGSALRAPVRTPSSVSSSASSGATCCSNKLTGLIAANNCNGYVHCVDGVDRGYIACASGLKFQRTGGFCDYANKVQCSSSCSSTA
jgi:Chitin binding Peritrophin-A domain